MAGQLGKRTTIGRLRQRVTIQTAARVSDEFGGKPAAVGWTDVATVRAEVVAVGGRELFQGGVVQANATHRVRMRHRGGFTPKHRLVWLDTGLVLNVVACPPEVGTANLIEVWCVREA